MQAPTTATCCTTPSALSLWAATFLVLYGSGLLLKSAWLPLARYEDTLLLAALAAACFVNFGWHRTLHCGLTGPIFALAAVAAALDEAGIWTIDIVALWGVVLAAVGVACLVEWRTFAEKRQE